MLIEKVNSLNTLVSNSSNKAKTIKRNVIPQANDEVSFTAKKLPTSKKFFVKMENFIKKLCCDDDDVDTMDEFWSWYTRS